MSERRRFSQEVREIRRRTGDQGVSDEYQEDSDPACSFLWPYRVLFSKTIVLNDVELMN
jgi:hypothetical protein